MCLYACIYTKLNTTLCCDGGLDKYFHRHAMNFRLVVAENKNKNFLPCLCLCLCILSAVFPSIIARYGVTR